ncbi:MAG: hypothetical protein IT370_23970 [Deltaproteobacteria bacterium]|nr:hypothetical protein [Deltaproteobacteria bacterium]
MRASPQQVGQVARLGVLALLGGVLGAGGGRAYAEETRCAPAAGVQAVGDETRLQLAVAELRDRLAERGIGEPVEACPAAHAEVAAAGAELVVDVEDVAGRHSRRTVSNAAAAASFIESWVRSDLSAPLLAPALVFPSAAAASEVARAADAPVLVRQAARPGLPALGIALGAQGAVASDGSVWGGLELAACVRLGRVCAGALARWNLELQSEERRENAQAERKSADLLVGADLPLRFGRVTLTPGLAAGVGWMHNGAFQVSERRIDEDSGGLRLAARLTVSMKLVGRWGLDLGATLDASPLARTESYVVESVTIPGEPRVYLRGMLGLRWGAP